MLIIGYDTPNLTFWFGKEESNEEEEGDGMGQGRTKPIPLAKPLLLKLAQVSR